MVLCSGSMCEGFSVRVCWVVPFAALTFRLPLSLSSTIPPPLLHPSCFLSPQKKTWTPDGLMWRHHVGKVNI